MKIDEEGVSVMVMVSDSTTKFFYIANILSYICYPVQHIRNDVFNMNQISTTSERVVSNTYSYVHWRCNPFCVTRQKS